MTGVADGGRFQGPPALAIIGAGAIAKSFHLPALARHPEVLARLIVVDRDAARAGALAAEFGAAGAASDFREVLPRVQGVVVTVPHHLHYPISLECLKAGVHVLCEKPLADTRQQTMELVQAASEAGVTLSVNNIRRLYPNFRRVHDMVRAGQLGALRRIEFFWGEVFDWPAATGGYFGLASGGRGVLFDKGSHILDLICWWVGGKPRVVSCRDDAFGGAEAMSSVLLQRDGCEITVEFSWLSRYPNTFSVAGELGALRGALFEWKSLEQVSTGGSRRTLNLATDARVPADFGRALIDNYLRVVAGTEAPLIPGEVVADSIDLLADCYAARTAYDLPWHDAWKRVVHG